MSCRCGIETKLGFSAKLIGKSREFLPLRNAGKSSPSLSGCILLKSSPKPALVYGLCICLCGRKLSVLFVCVEEDYYSD